MKTQFHEFKLSSKYKGNKNWANGSNNKNNHIITVRNTETGKLTRFEFWESVIEKEIKTEKQLLWAFYCFMSDALAYIQNHTIDDFADEFGYTKISEAIRIYKACKASADKTLRIGLDEDRLCDLLNEINEMEDVA